MEDFGYILCKKLQMQEMISFYSYTSQRMYFRKTREFLY